MRTPFTRLIEEARTVRVEDVIAQRGIVLRGRGVDRCGPCPVCGGTDRFAINVRKQVFLCRQCGNKGNVIALVAFLDGVDVATAVHTLTGTKPNGGGDALARAIQKKKAKDTPKLVVVPPKEETTEEAPKDTVKKVVAATFTYTDEAGVVIYVVDRVEFQNADGTFVLKDGKRKKSFRQRRPDPDRPGGWIYNLDGITRVPHRLLELVEAVASGRLVFIVEGEGKVDLLRSIGITATTNNGGAGKWEPSFNEYLRGADVVLVPDNDAPGLQHVNDIAASLVGIAARTRVLMLPDLPPKGDVNDYLAMGATREQFDALVEAAQDWQPPTEEAKPTDEGEAETSEETETATWDDPDFSILEDRRGELPNFPTDIFTPDWQELLERIARGAGVRVEHVVVPLLGVASSLIGTARRVRASRGWSEPLTVWTVLVAQSGERKTPGIRATTGALDLIEKNNTANNSEKRLKHETVVQKAKEAMKKWKEERETALEAKPPKEPPPMPIGALDPGNFIEPRLYATDPTIERLASLLCARPRGMMLIRDELSGLFANMRRYSGGSDRPFWLEAWNGGRHIVERVSGSIVVEHLLVGVVGGFQPDKLERAFAGDEDGMSGRFLYAWPVVPEYQKLSNDATEMEPDLVNVLTALIRLPSEDDKDLFVPQYVWLADEAIVEFEAFRAWHDKAKRGTHDLERQWFAKGETIVLRLAGTLSYMTWAIKLGTANSVDGIVGAMEPVNIDKQFVTAAIRLWKDFFWPHARAALRQIGMSDRHRNERRALQWIRANGKSEVSREDIRRDALGQRLDAEETQELIDELVRVGWFRELPSASGPKGGKPARRWAVNPKLLAGAV